jgi:dihydrolipoamide dehydrogenase
MSDTAFDLAIIGAGPGGYVSAIRAAHRGLRVALVEEKDLGGVCLHTGCIPTKTMIASVDLLRQARSATQLGVTVAQAEAHLATINARRQKVVQQLAGGVKNLLEKNQVQVFRGRGVLKSPTQIELTPSPGTSDPARSAIRNPQSTLTAKSILLATGSRPADLPIARRDGAAIWSSDDLLASSELPAELLILGGGYIGCEFASLYAALGSKVTVIEALPRLLPGLDKELGQSLERSFKKAGISVLLNCKVESVSVEKADSSPVTVRLADGLTLSGSKLLVSVGRVPNVEGLGLENVGVKLTGRCITVDDFMETSAPGVFAIGDVTGKIALAHVASAQGRVVVENLLAARSGQPRKPMNYDAVPACVFTHPEIATVGLTEEEAAQRGLTVKVGRFPFAAIGKALALGETEGFVKLVADATTGRLLGGHIFGGHAAELIGQLTLAVRLGATAEQLTETIFAHPTLSEAILESAEAVFGKATHVFTRR